jgi:hypothetical protein
VTITPREPGIYALAPHPFAVDSAEFALAGRPIAGQHDVTGRARGTRAQDLERSIESQSNARRRGHDESKDCSTGHVRLGPEPSAVRFGD